MTVREPLMPVLLEKVYQLIQDKLELAQQPLVNQLAQHLFSNIAQDDLLERNESDLYGAVVSLWHHLNDKKPQDISVRVFNPTVSKQVGNRPILSSRLLCQTVLSLSTRLRWH